VIYYLLYVTFISGIMSAVCAVHWLMSRLVPKRIDPHCSYTKLYSDVDFRYVVDHSESTKPGLLVFHSGGYWLLKCRWATRYPIYPSKGTRDSVLDRSLYSTESFLKVFCFFTQQGQKRFIVTIRLESSCSSVWLGDLKVI